MSTPAFDPTRRLTIVNGADYLEVKWRLVWLRSQHPDAHVETRLVSHDDLRAIFTATVSVPDGGSATGWGSEHATGFPNYIEAAETKAIGRALAALGFGTQFCTDFESGPEHQSLADAPVALRSFQESQPELIADARPRSESMQATDRQRGLIAALGKERKLDRHAMDDLSREVTGRGSDDLSRRDASTLIEHLKDNVQVAGRRSA